MRKSDVVKHFGSQSAIARELGIGKAAVSKWPPTVPRPWAAELHVRTRGKLKFKPNDYSDSTKPANATQAA